MRLYLKYLTTLFRLIKGINMNDDCIPYVPTDRKDALRYALALMGNQMSGNLQMENIQAAKDWLNSNSCSGNHLTNKDLLLQLPDNRFEYLMNRFVNAAYIQNFGIKADRIMTSKSFYRTRLRNWFP
jgi:hypothetical protein